MAALYSASIQYDIDLKDNPTALEVTVKLIWESFVDAMRDRHQLESKSIPAHIQRLPALVAITNPDTPAAAAPAQQLPAAAATSAPAPAAAASFNSFNSLAMTTASAAAAFLPASSSSITFSSGSNNNHDDDDLIIKTFLPNVLDINNNHHHNNNNLILPPTASSLDPSLTAIEDGHDGMDDLQALSSLSSLLPTTTVAPLPSKLWVEVLKKAAPAAAAAFDNDNEHLLDFQDFSAHVLITKTIPTKKVEVAPAFTMFSSFNNHHQQQPKSPPTPPFSPDEQLHLPAEDASPWAGFLGSDLFRSAILGAVGGAVNWCSLA